MNRFALAVLAALALSLSGSPPAAAEVRNCTNALVTAGVCPTNSHVLLYFAVPAGDVQGIRDAVAALINYVPGTSDLCTAGRVTERLCTQAELGQVIPASQVVSRWVRAVLIARYKEHQAQAAAETARQAAIAGADPAIP